MRIALAFCFVSAVSAVAFVAWAQTESADQAKPQIRSLSHAIHAVEDLDTTLAFYRDVFGLKGTPQDFPNPAVPQLTNAPGVTLRLSMMRLPGSMLFELTHFKGLERKPARAAYTESWRWQYCASDVRDTSTKQWRTPEERRMRLSSPSAASR